MKRLLIATSLILFGIQFFIGLAYSVPKILPKPNMRGKSAPKYDKYKGDCEKCHVAWKGVKEKKCLECHGGIKEQLNSKEGLHFIKFKGTCVSCHPDHHGRDFKIDFDESKFQHKDAGYELIGKHAQLKCNQCHTSEGKRKIVPQPKIGKYIGLQTECIFCHQKDDAGERGHNGQLGDKCDECHTEKAWKPSTFDVNRHDESEFKLFGKHQEVRCEKCHADGRYKGLNAKCIDCHKKDEQEKGHKGQLGDECERCHTADGWKPSTFTELDHQNTGYPLDGRHIDVPCSKCHKNGKYKKLDTSCYACHRRDDEEYGHLGELGKVCEDCHTVYGWAPSTFDIERHNLLDFKLTGK
ncbi:MAG: cytochrome c3 family protein, partial [Candidatus Poribacteria bacterium]